MWSLRAIQELLRRLVINLVIYVPLLSITLSMMIFHVIGFIGFETALRELIVLSFALALFYLFGISHKFSAIALPFLQFVVCILAYTVLSLSKGQPFVPIIRDVRDILIFPLLIIIGNLAIRPSDMKSAVKVLLIISFIVIPIEMIVTPPVMWEKLGYKSYYLEWEGKQIERSEGTFSGYLTDESFETKYYNYSDSFSQEKKPYFRYGGLVCEPIIYGHIFSFLMLYCLMNYKTFGNKTLLFIVLATGVVILRTKGIIVPLIIYLYALAYYRFARLRALVIALSLGTFALIMYLSFAYDLATVGHILVLLNGFESLVDTNFIGSGFGVSKLDDSFIGRLMMQGGLVLPASFLYMTFRIYKQYGRCGGISAHLKQAFLLATILPTFFTSAGSSLVALLLPAYYMGCLIKDRTVTTSPVTRSN